MTFEEYLIQVSQDYLKNSPNIRLGQQYYNTLFEVKPALARYINIRAKHVDPYRDDSKLPEFLRYIANLWDNPWTDLTLEEYGLLRWRDTEGQNQGDS